MVGVLAQVLEHRRAGLRRRVPVVERATFPRGLRPRVGGLGPVGLPGLQVTRGLNRLVGDRGLPELITVDNALAFASHTTHPDEPTFQSTLNPTSGSVVGCVPTNSLSLSRAVLVEQDSNATLGLQSSKLIRTSPPAASLGIDPILEIESA